MFHICPNEIMAATMALPFIGAAFHWLIHKVRGERKCQTEPCKLTKCVHESEAVLDPLDP